MCCAVGGREEKLKIVNEGGAEEATLVGATAGGRGQVGVKVGEAVLAAAARMLAGVGG